MTARKPSAVARELLRNFPKGGKKRRRRKKGKAEADGTAKTPNDQTEPTVEETAASAPVQQPEHEAYSSDQHD